MSDTDKPQIYFPGEVGPERKSVEVSRLKLVVEKIMFKVPQRGGFLFFYFLIVIIFSNHALSLTVVLALVVFSF